jgi:hypothetical protein
MRTRIILKTISQLHPDVVTWQSNVTANGGTYNDTDTNALNDFMTSINDFKTKFARLNLGIGTDLAACCTPQVYISGNGGSYDTPTNYTNSNYSRTNGIYMLTPSTGYQINTQYVPSSDSNLQLNDNSIGFFSGGGLAVGWNNNTFDVHGDGGGVEWGVECKYSNGNTFFLSMSVNYDTKAGLNYYGFFVVRRTDANTVKLYLNDTLESTAVRASVGKPSNEVKYMEAPNYERKSFGYFIGYDLTTSEMTTLYNAWNTLNTAIGR